MNMMYYPEGTEDVVRSLVEISREFGGNPDYVLAGGGNTSVKEGPDIFVKASGTQLGSIAPDGFVQMSRKALNDIWSRDYPDDADAREEAVLEDMLNARSIAGDTRRPSVESLLHEMFPYKYVVHTHPSMVNGLTCSKENLAAAKKLLGNDTVWLPVIDPGYILAREVKTAVDAYTERHGIFPRVVFLQNHGVFVAADSPAEIRDIYSRIMSGISEGIGQFPAVGSREPDRAEADSMVRRILDAIPGSSCRMFSNKDIDDLIAGREAFGELKLSPTPDHIVYCGYRPLFVENPGLLEEEIEGFYRSEGFQPRIIAVKGLGVAAVHETETKTALAQQLFLDNVRIVVYARSFGGVQFMPDANIDFIRNWEAEKYRASQSS